MDADHFITSLNDYFGVKNFSDTSLNGLQVEGKKRVNKVATAVSANLQTIERAVLQQVDLLIVHHGLFWKNQEMIFQGSLKSKMRLLLDNEITLLAYHLPMDAHPQTGNNWKVAKDLQWERQEPFGEYGGSYIGVKGYFPKIAVGEFVKKLESYYEHAAFTALGGKKEITCAALVSGGAYKMVADAARQGVDCFITGNFDEPAWSIAHEEGIHFLALGHSSTEKVGPKALANYIMSTYGISCEFIDIFNPF
jgi:dinuclear metal center YbgI/SA1388 family protein